MELKITKGDWKSDYFTVESNRKIVADCGFSDNGHDKEERANAHLIAAAPDMYEMIKDYHRKIEFRLDNDVLSECERWDLRDSRQNIEELLAKARGE